MYLELLPGVVYYASYTGHFTTRRSDLIVLSEDRQADRQYTSQHAITQSTQQQNQEKPQMMQNHEQNRQQANRDTQVDDFNF